ncbi:ABC transporter substrate-binding protein [Faecalicatena contorta]|uniref:ABC-type nitrate/sulfonate/bicarbonate transport system, substrate-binding protein n=1 Tax=Faecalicatena contorta TaxID=39482 RepID=A0A315ZTG5_9FIRM|nr:ABC transporter substrate-binding protein [Faecalicatena contorta]PWJ48599.1 ABC-type nitrate/sulfonate/bicarbonate transport system substrate-binding protein [Faecalicatena contorta]SUQ15335.1 ABC-type nitrate/sulfonate/bicarbonate transport system, substrate-binding protein [Faecalicatena contorta]
MKLKKLMKAAALGLSVTLLAGALAGCGKSGKGGSGSGEGGSEAAQYELNVSGIGGSLNFLPVYIAQEKGLFEEAGLTIEETLFTNGPVQMESLSSDGWDIGCTGVGGVFAGVLGYDAKVVGASNTDDGTQYVFARNDSEIVAAGTGNNSINDEIYGDADSWRGKSILCNTGSVTQYVLIKMLEGFGLTQDDVTFVAMDPATAYSAFLAGEGDVCVLTGSGGTFKMLEQDDKYTAVASGPLVDSGLMCNFVVNKNSYEDEDTYEAMKIFLEVYFETLEWMRNNEEEVVDYCVDMNDENGSSLDPETARQYVKADTYYTLDEAIAMMEDTADGSELTVMEQNLVNVLEFFVSVGNYTKDDLGKFEGHTDVQLLKDVQSAE